MSSELPYVMTRLPVEYLRRWKAHCASLGMTSSDALRAAMSQFMGEGSPAVRFVAISEKPDKSRRRQEIRLANSEIAGISQLAEAFGASRRNYLVNLVRGHLLRQPQLGMTELAVIGESNKHLAALGRHFNQIAKKLNSGENVEALCVAQALNRFKGELDEHLTYVHRVMRSNLDRWSIAGASNDDDR